MIKAIFSLFCGCNKLNTIVLIETENIGTYNDVTENKIIKIVGSNIQGYEI